MNINSMLIKFKGAVIKFKGFINESKRVITVTKKPDKTEFIRIVKASALGVLILGLIGFIIQMVAVLFFR